MKNIFFSILVSFILLLDSGCCKCICSSDAGRHGEKFQAYLDYISDFENGKKKGFVYEYRNAIFFLSFTTGISTKSEYSSTFGYNSRRDFKDDMHSWKSWYKVNKCLLTDLYIDSVYKKLGLIYRK